MQKMINNSCVSWVKGSDCETPELLMNPTPSLTILPDSFCVTGAAKKWSIFDWI